MDPFQTTPEPATTPSDSTESLTGVFFWLAGAAVLFGGLPYLYPAGST